jgi:Mor family transcriptional regulator
MAGSETHTDILYEEVFNVAKKLGIGQQLSDDMARMVDDGVRRRCGGGHVYVAAPGNESRDARLYRDYVDGLPVRRIMQKYAISKTSVYRIVSNMRS